MKIIAFGHYSDVGKDTAANMALRHLRTSRHDINTQKVEFARPLKDMTYFLYRWTGIHEPDYYETNRKARDVVIEALGMTMVELWVAVGQAMRNNVYEHTWTVAALDCDCELLILSDLRFPVEVEELRKHDSLLIQVVREGHEPRDTEADQALVGWDGWDHVIENNGSMHDLYATVERLVNGFVPAP